MRQEEYHQPVLLAEVIANLAIKPEGVYIDATLGRGGHAKEILCRLSEKGRLVVIDQDPTAVAYARRAWGADPRVQIYKNSFIAIKEIITSNGLIGKVNGILFDLGVSTPQLEKAERGFSFLKEGFLDMRMDPERGMTAAHWLAVAPEQEIAQVLKEYGEERYAKRIAKAINAARNQQAIVTTLQLANIVKQANPRWEKHKHPATRTFQAIRIRINHELEDLPTALEQSLEVLTRTGRLLVISFHSLEDRIVKHFIRKYSQEPMELKRLPGPTQWRPRLKKLGSGIKPGARAIAENPRSRSALLRVAEKLL
jgi:16S rRNA (cytosine1402-N4)-methyltransferase